MKKTRKPHKRNTYTLDRPLTEEQIKERESDDKIFARGAKALKK